jgi:hypothetical protein
MISTWDQVDPIFPVRNPENIGPAGRAGPVRGTAKKRARTYHARANFNVAGSHK